MSDDEMMLNLVAPAGANEDPVPSKKRRTFNKREPTNKQRKHTADQQISTASKHSAAQEQGKKKPTPNSKDDNKPKNPIRKPGKPSQNIRGGLTQDLALPVRQTKQEIEEKKKEMFDQESESGFAVINSRMKESLEKQLNITKPTKIQLKSIPYILAKNDILMKSKTGSGKTLAYLLPCLHLLQEKRTTRADGTYMVIIAPTRELALQITEVATVLLRQFPWIVFGSLMGGEPKKKEKARIRKGLSVVVATPGRLLDHLQNTASFEVSKLEWMILDEADRLLDLGFEFALRKIISIFDERKQKNLKRQNLLISATLEGRIKKLANISLQSPIFVNLADDSEAEPIPSSSNRTIHTVFDEEEDATAPMLDDVEEDNEEENYQVPKHLLQSYTIVETKQKLVALVSFLRLQSFSSPDSCKILVFVLTTDIVEFLYSLFMNGTFQNTDEDGETFEEEIFGVPLFKLHGNMSQAQRTGMFTKYRSSKKGILFCTDVAARGLDVPDIKWIVQYDAPTETKEYVHRIGRTARFTGKGRSVIFLSPAEKGYISHLEEHQLNIREINMSALLNTLQIPLTSGKRKPPQIRLQEFLESVVSKNKKLSDFACNAFRSYIRGYATYPKLLKGIFHVKSLHLGHVAKMFALTEAPSKLPNIKNLKKSTKKDESNQTKKSTKPNQPQIPTAAQRMMSEFSAG